MKCVSEGELRIVEQTLQGYDLTKSETTQALKLIEARARDTSQPFKPYNAAHNAASQITQKRKL